MFSRGRSIGADRFVEARKPQSVIEVVVIVWNGLGGHIVRLARPAREFHDIDVGHCEIHADGLHFDFVVVIARAHDERSARAGSDVAVGRTIDHDLGPDEAAASLVLHDDAGHRTAVEDRTRDHGFEENLDASVGTEARQQHLHDFGVAG
jgi:hypothetical protein